MIADFVMFAVTGLFMIISTFVLILPEFDVVKYIHTEGEIFQQGLSWLNWFVPVDQLFIIAGVWLTCLVFYQAYLVFGGFFFKITG